MWSRMHEKKSARGLGSHFTKSCRCSTNNKSFTPSPLPTASRSVINSSVFSFSLFTLSLRPWICSIFYCKYLQYSFTAKEKEIAFPKQTLVGTDKDIANLEEKLSQLKQTVQTTQSDFVKHMASIDEKLQEAKKKIAELEGALILLSRRVNQKQKSPGANHKHLMVNM